MTKEELKVKVEELKNIRKSANEQIYNAVMEYISGLPYKVDDQIKTMYKVGWIATITPEYNKDRDEYTGEIDIRINPAKKLDGTRSERLFKVDPFEQQTMEIIKPEEDDFDYEEWKENNPASRFFKS